MSSDDQRNENLDYCKSEFLPDMPIGRSFAAAAAIGENRLLVIGGGLAEDESMKSGSIYERNTRRWQTLEEEMTTGRHEFAVAATHGKVYAVGGRTGVRSDTATLEAWDIPSGKWESLEPMKDALRQCSAVASPGFVYVFGGYKEIGNTQAWEFVGHLSRYDIKHDKWQSLAPLPTARANSVAAIVNGKA